MANQFPAGYMPRYGLSSRPVTQILPQQPMMPSVRQMPVASMPAGSAIAQLALRRPTMPSGGPLRQPPAPTFPGLAQRAAQAATQRLAAATPAPQPAVHQRRRGFLEADFMSPRGQALAAAAETGLQLSGYQDRPITLGQGLGALAQAARQAYQAQKLLEQEAATAQSERALKERELRQKLRIEQLKLESGAGKKVFENEKKLRDEFTKQSKDFVEQLGGLEKVQKSALAEKPSGATDVALIFGFMKVLDPGSVVREGEFATAQNAQGISDRIRSQYNRILRGETLTPESRKNFLDAAREQFMPALARQNRLENEYRQLADSYDLNADKIVMSKLPEEGSLANPKEVNTDEEALDLPLGTYFIKPNGSLGFVRQGK